MLAFLKSICYKKEHELPRFTMWDSIQVLWERRVSWWRGKPWTTLHGLLAASSSRESQACRCLATRWATTRRKLTYDLWPPPTGGQKSHSHRRPGCDSQSCEGIEEAPACNTLACVPTLSADRSVRPWRGGIVVGKASASNPPPCGRDS